MTAVDATLRVVESGTPRSLTAGAGGDIDGPATRDAVTQLQAAVSALNDVLTALAGTLTVTGAVTTGALTDTELRAAPVPVDVSFPASQEVTGALTDTELRAAPVPIAGTVTVTDLETGLAKDTTTSEVRDRLPAELDTRGLKVADVLTQDAAAEATGNDASQTLDLGVVCDLIFVRVDGADGRALVSDTPTTTHGRVCEDGIDTAFPVRSQTINVHAPSGATVTVWGGA